MNSRAFLVVMAGGSGTRFWPKSTSKKPKQLLSFGVGQSSLNETLLQQTLSRFSGIVASSQRLVVTTQSLSKSVAEQAGDAQILAEPQGRNTAPCVYWAAREVYARDPKGVMLVMPSDHYISFPDRFRKTVEAAVQWADTHDDLVTLGVKPTRPETGYGYLKVAPTGTAEGSHKVESFVEKPNLEKAESFLKSGNYLWNGGMFIWRAEVVLRAFDACMPEMKKAWETSSGDIEKAYPQMTATSIDYGIMEKAKNVVTFALDCGWDDLGSWTSLESLSEALGATRTGGVVTGGDLLAVESQGNIVDTPGKLTAILGLSDLIVVEHGGAILIAPKNRAQDIRLIVEQVKKLKPELA
jgi:mannose-1-phosphate guanylyltransferase